jgi:Polyketide cyclase / dehydrase and lipid transport
MAPIVTTAEIGRPAAEVFAYATDPARFSEWQKGVVDGHMDSPGNGTETPAVGARCVTTRRIGGASRPSTSELTHIDPPRAWAYGEPTARSGQRSTSWSSQSPAPALG